jgi:hypothetical protein
MNKFSIITTSLFFIIYTFCITIGSIFVVSWGGVNIFKTIIVFMMSFPINWFKLIEDNILYLFVNILCWSLIVYVFSYLLEKLIIFNINLIKNKNLEK